MMDQINMEDALINYFKQSSVASISISLFLLKVSAPFRYLMSIVMVVLWAKRSNRRSKLKNQLNSVNNKQSATTNPDDSDKK